MVYLCRQRNRVNVKLICLSCFSSITLVAFIYLLMHHGYLFAASIDYLWVLCFLYALYLPNVIVYHDLFVISSPGKSMLMCFARLNCSGGAPLMFWNQ